MPLPTARHPSGDVGATGDAGPSPVPCPRRKSVACFGAMQYRCGKLVTEMVTPFNAVTFKAFRRTLLRHRGRGQAQGGGAGQRHGPPAWLLGPFLREHRRVLTLRFLPPYSPPHANPIERVWKLARRLATPNRYFATLDELLAAAQERFALWRNPNRQLARLFGIS